MADLATWTDPNLADVQIELADAPGGEITNAAVLLVRPDQLVSDESGEHPGERFASVTIKRAELLDILQLLEEDWQDHCQHADLMADDTPLMTAAVRGRVDVLLGLLTQASEVIATIEAEDEHEERELQALLDHIDRAVDEMREEG